MTSKHKNSEDLGIKIGSQSEALWTKVVEAREATIKNLKEALIVEEIFLNAAKDELSKAIKENEQAD